MVRSVSVRLSEFACEAVAGQSRDVDHLSEMVARAIRCYVRSSGSTGSGWSYPGFMQDGKQEGGVRLALSIDDDLWHSLEEEAERQGTSTEEMVAHATLWFAAEVDAGRVTRRIVEGLDEAAGDTRAG